MIAGGKRSCQATENYGIVRYLKPTQHTSSGSIFVEVFCAAKTRACHLDRYIQEE